jgi:hypothetical protein
LIWKISASAGYTTLRNWIGLSFRMQIPQAMNRKIDRTSRLGFATSKEWIEDRRTMSQARDKQRCDDSEVDGEQR